MVASVGAAIAKPAAISTMLAMPRAAPRRVPSVVGRVAAAGGCGLGGHGFAFRAVVGARCARRVHGRANPGAGS